MKDDLSLYREKFLAILNDDRKTSYEKDIELRQLMIELEYKFDIPLLLDKDYCREFPDVMKLYTQISYAINFD